jgi:hypothetical protein
MPTTDFEDGLTTMREILAENEAVSQPNRDREDQIGLLRGYLERAVMPPWSLQFVREGMRQ